VPSTIQDMRRERLFGSADLRIGTGLEIGPLHRPLVTREMADLRYVDVSSEEDLRAHYASDPNVVTTEIPSMDFVLRDSDRIKTVGEAAAPDAPYSWIVASHVIEHVPDIVGWLADLATLTNDDAKVYLVIPDRRFTFDAHRPPTTVGQMLEANFRRDRTPSVRAVYDYFRSVITIDAPDAWAGRVPGREARIHDLDGAMAQVGLARNEGQYIDCHVWLFTPESFVEQIVELGEIGLCDFVVDSVIHTFRDELEFYAVLRRLPRGLEPESKRAALQAGLQTFPDQIIPSQ